MRGIVHGDIARVLMLEKLLGRIGLRLLWGHGMNRVLLRKEILKRMGVVHKVRVEVLKLHDGVMCVKTMDGMRERQGSIHAHAWSMEVAGLWMIEGAKATWGRGVIARRLVCKGGKGKRIGIHQGRGESP